VSANAAASTRPRLLPVSARDPAALAALAAALRDLLDTGAPRLDDVCFTLGARRSHHEHRAFALGRTREELVEGLARIAKGEAPPPAPALPEGDEALVRAARPLLDLELAFLEAVGDPRPVVRGDADAAQLVREGIEALARHWGLDPAELAREATGPPAGDLPLALLHAAGRCYARGLDLDWPHLSPAGARVVRLPRYAWQRRSLWIGHRAEQAEPAEPAADGTLDGWVRARLATVLGAAPDEVDLDAPLERLGLDSLMALELANAAEEEHGAAVDLEALRHETGRELAARIEAAAGEGTRLPRAEPDPDASFEPFGLTEIQRAYYVGRSEDWELGGVSCHFYREFEREGLDVDRLEQAVNAVVERHPMLRAAIESPQSQRVLPEVDPVTIRAVDLTRATEEQVEAALERLRGQLSHRVRPADRPPLVELRALKLPGGRTRVAVSLDLIAADGRSWLLFGSEVDRLYEDPAAELEPIGLTFRDYAAAERELERSERYERARAYWLDRLDDLPGPPPLPLAAAPAEVGRPRFRRLQHLLGGETWRAFADRGRAAGVTPSTALCFAFSHVLADWSGSPRFTLNLTTSNRLPLHPDVPKLIGDFTALTLLDVDVDAGDRSFAAGAARLRERLWTDLGHRIFSGLSVLRERAARNDGDDPGMPVVFTSLLGQAPEGAPPPFSCLGEVAYAVSQTPQVWLDHQLVEEGDGVRLSWDAVEGLFDADALEAAFARYVELVEELARSEEAWQRPVRAAGAGAGR
jgi:acyl carrier protein